MAEGFIVRKGGVTSETTAAPTITIISETETGVTFTLTNNDDNTAFITYEIDTTLETIELAAAATSSNITVELAVGTYTLTAYATVVGEVASSEIVSVEISLPSYELLGEVNVATATTQIDFDNLNITKADELRLVYTFISTGSQINYEVFPNDQSNNSNYWFQRLQGVASSLGAVRVNENRFTDAVTNNVGFADIKISNNDRFVVQSQYTFRTGSNASEIQNRNDNMVSTISISSISKLSVKAKTSLGIRVGSRLQLYKVNTGVA